MKYMSGNTLNQNQGVFYQFNIENRVSLIPSDFPMEKLLVVLVIALLVFLSVVLNYQISKKKVNFRQPN